jgi:protein-tyrosine phosphatase
VTSPGGSVFAVSWHAPRTHHVVIYAGTDPGHVGRDRKVAEGAGDGKAVIADLPPASRWYFELVPDAGQVLTLADRSLHLSTAANFRDVGGYRTLDGHWVRMGLAYRSNELNHLKPAELATLTTLGLKLVCDLRTDEERQRGPDLVPAGVTDVSANVLADDAEKTHAFMNAAQPAGGNAKPAPSVDTRAIYRDFVDLPSAQKSYALLFRRLADPAALPTVFHCSAGKDRTGWAQAVLLTILDVPRATIYADYRLTDRYLTGEALANLRQHLQSTPLAAVPVVSDPADLDAAFDEVTRRYGSFEAYLHQGLGLDDATLDAIRRNFLAG